MAVTVVGPLPPPVNGFANVTLRFASLLRQRTAVHVCNRAPSGSRPRAVEEVVRLLWYLRMQVSRRTRSRCTYIAVSGGLGQVFDVAYATIAHLTGQRIVLHHHSFAYLDARQKLTSLLFRSARRANHICLCDEMASKLSRQYRIDRGRVSVISNAAFIEKSGSAVSRPGKLIVGFFSALSPEKGIDVFLDVVRSPRLQGRIDVKVAGALPPVRAKAVLDLLNDVRAEYFGLVDSEAKEKYLESLDVLLFPSRYRNEAEPVAVLEAMSKGVAVLATARGCIGSMIMAGGEVLDEADFCEKACSLISAWDVHRIALEEKKRGALAAFQRHRDRSTQRASDLIEWMISK